MTVELGDDATYLVKRLGYVSFHMPSSDIIKLNYVCFVHGLKKKLLSLSCMIGF